MKRLILVNQMEVKSPNVMKMRSNIGQKLKISVSVARKVTNMWKKSWVGKTVDHANQKFIWRIFKEIIWKLSSPPQHTWKISTINFKHLMLIERSGCVLLKTLTLFVIRALQSHILVLTAPTKKIHSSRQKRRSVLQDALENIFTIRKHLCVRREPIWPILIPNICYLPQPNMGSGPVKLPPICNPLKELGTALKEDPTLSWKAKWLNALTVAGESTSILRRRNVSRVRTTGSITKKLEGAQEYMMIPYLWIGWFLTSGDLLPTSDWIKQWSYDFYLIIIFVSRQ